MPPTMPDRAPGITASRIISHLRRAERERRLALRPRHGHQHLAGHRRDVRQDHDRQDDAGRQHPGAVRDRRRRSTGRRDAGSSGRTAPRRSASAVRARRCPTARTPRSASAASRSTRNATGWASHRGASSDRKTAVPIASGVAMMRAMIDEASVPKIAGPAPNCPCTGSHALRGDEAKAELTERRPPGDEDLDCDERQQRHDHQGGRGGEPAIDAISDRRRLHARARARPVPRLSIRRRRLPKAKPPRSSRDDRSQVNVKARVMSQRQADCYVTAG